MLVTKKNQNQVKYLLDQMLLATHASLAEYHIVSTANALETPHLPSFKRWLFKCSSSVGLSEALITSGMMAET